MTLEEIKRSDKVFLFPKDIAPILKVAENSIRIAAKQRPELLGFPITIIGTRTLIPKQPFLNYLEGKNSNEENNA